MRKNSFLSVVIAVVMVCMFLPVTSIMATSNDIIYVDENGAQQTKDVATVMTEASTVLTDGWYVVSDNVAVDDRITVTGDVHLILSDDNKLTAERGIELAEGHSLTIYGQVDGTGELVAGVKVYTDAAIGSANAGNITINGGIITATASEQGAGIGGSRSLSVDKGGSGGIVVINGGSVVASGSYGAGIGGSGSGVTSGEGGDAGSVTINGGTVTASSSEGAGIGGGSGTSKGGAGGIITINGGIVNAESSWTAAIGGGFGKHIATSTGGDGATVVIRGGTVTAISAQGCGIGGGLGASVGNVGTFSANGNAFIVANEIQAQDDKANWSGVVIEGDSGSTYGSTVTLTTSATVPAGVTLNVTKDTALTVDPDIALTIDGKMVNRGTMGFIDGTILNVQNLFHVVTIHSNDANAIVTEAEFAHNVPTALTKNLANVSAGAVLAGWGTENSTTVDYEVGELVSFTNPENIYTVLSNLTIDKTTLALNVGETQEIIATLTPTSMQVGTWSSSNTAVATVDANGLVTAISSGTANITYTVGGLSASAVVSVNEVVLAPSVPSTEIPSTGDSSNNMLAVGMCVLSAFMICVVVYKNRIYKN